MKQFLCICLCCIYLCGMSSVAHSQQNVVTVNGNSITTSSNKIDQKQVDNATLRCAYAFSKKKEGAASPYRTDTMYLEIGNTFSRFYDPARLGRDSALSATIKGMSAQSIKSVSVFNGTSAKDLSGMQGTVGSNATEGESYQIYKNKPAAKVTVIDYVAGGRDKFRYEDEIGVLPWKITETTDTILSYTCQKATLHFRGRDYTAWFAAEIPVSDGPWKFMGLPGLILKVEDDKQLFSFSLVGLQQLTNPKPLLMDDPKTNVKCTRAEFEKQKKKQGLGQQFNLNGGNVIIAEIPGKFDYLPMEIE